MFARFPRAEFWGAGQANLLEGYRSGHNGAVLKDCGLLLPEQAKSLDFMGFLSYSYNLIFPSVAKYTTVQFFEIMAKLPGGLPKRS